MGIVSSVAIVDAAVQISGGRYVTERHTATGGAVHQASYCAPEGFDVQARLAASAVTLAARLASDEVDEALSRPGVALVLLHQTPAEFALAFWTRVRAAFDNNKIEYGRLIWWIAGMVTAGHVTDAQARISFNTAFERSLTAQQWNTLKTNRLIPARDRYQALLDETILWQ